MAEPHIAFTHPAEVEVVAGKNYAWCACGLSEKQPFCDGHHKTTEFKPVVFKAEETKKVWLCQCKHTHTPPYCDGTHKTLQK